MTTLELRLMDSSEVRANHGMLSFVPAEKVDRCEGGDEEVC